VVMMDPKHVAILQKEIDEANEALGEAVSDNNYAEAARQQIRLEVLEDLNEKFV